MLPVLFVMLAVNKGYAEEVCETVNLDWSQHFSNFQLRSSTAPISRTLGTTFPTRFTYDTTDNGASNLSVINGSQNGQAGIRIGQRARNPATTVTTNWSWDQPVQGINFEIVDIDNASSFTDNIRVTIIDENGATVDLVEGVNYFREGTNNVIREVLPNHFRGVGGSVNGGNRADLRIELPDTKIRSVMLEYFNSGTTTGATHITTYKDFSWESCASLAIDKPAPSVTNDLPPAGISIGDTLTYTITATNDGNTRQRGLVVNDPMLSPNSRTCVSVAAGGTCVLTGTYVVQATDAGGTIDNTASVVSNEVPTPTTDDESTPVQPALPPTVSNDSSTGNPPGTSVTTNILTNDTLSGGGTPNPGDVTVTLDASSVPGGTQNADGSVNVPGEGVWRYNPSTGELTFDPCTAPGVPNADCLGALLSDPSPIDYAITETATGLSSNSGTVTVGYTPTTISGTLVNDIDGNGREDVDDDVLAGVTVNLLDSGGNPVLDENGDPVSAVTDQSGNYSFVGNFPAGAYQIAVDPSTLPGATPQNPGGTATFDPNGIGSPNVTSIQITPGANVSNQNFGYTGNTLPVTLSAVSSERIGNQKIKLNWSTSSELFNVGFQLWGLDGKDSKWENLHDWLIRSGSGNAVEPQSYSRTVSLPASINDLVAVGVSSVDSDGSEHYYGPFDVGQAYGNLDSLKAIAWDQIRDQVDGNMAKLGYIKKRVNGFRKASGAQAAGRATESVIELEISESGMYRITAQQLQRAGQNWSSVSRRNIALIDHRGKAVVRSVSARGSGTGLDKTLGASGEIYFYAKGVDEKAGLFTNTSVYRLVRNSALVLEAKYQSRQGVNAGFSGFYMETTRVENDTRYVLNSMADDPWVEAVVLSYPNRTGAFAAGVPVETDALWSKSASMTLDLARSSGLTAVDRNADGQADPEHLIEGKVLSSSGGAGLVSLGTKHAVGKGQWRVKFSIPKSTPLSLVDGKAVVGGTFSAGRGYAFSEIHVDAASVTYARPYESKSNDDYLTFTAPQTGESGYAVTVPDTGWPVAFALNNQAELVRLAIESQSKVTTSNGLKKRLVKVASLIGSESQSSTVQYWISGKGGFLEVSSISSKSVTSRSNLLLQAADSNFLMVAHPAFLGATLNRYANFKRSKGYRVAVVDYLEIVDSFGGGQPGPFGLTRFLAQVEARGDLEHVLIVGGSSYDHTGKLKNGSMTFIPGHYAPSGHSKFTVSDVPYITRAKNQLFASIGRWPVRSTADLNTIVNKSIAWSRTNHRQGEVLAIAEHTVPGENIDFAAAVDSLLPLLPSQWESKRVYVDKIMESNPGMTVTQALAISKKQIITQLNKTPEIVLFNGHGTTGQLSNKGLFKAQDVKKINSSGAEIWLPLSCYLTYYESTHVNTITHKLMFDGNAVGISGAMLLSGQRGNIAAGKAILSSIFNAKYSLGEAVNKHKSRQGSKSLNINWAVLGDSSLKLNH